MRESEAVQLLAWNGAPLSCHLMLTSGDRATLGLLSPGDRRIERGDRFTTAYGIWGALNCRAGFVVADSEELPPDIQDYTELLVALLVRRRCSKMSATAQAGAEICQKAKEWALPAVLDNNVAWQPRSDVLHM